jgi:glycolate oxidase FAD binding subunit
MVTAAGAPIDVRDGTAACAVDGVVARLVGEPASADEFAAALAWASNHGLSAVIRGSGTKDEWGRPPKAIDLLLSTRRLNRVLMHRAGDLTVSVEAGITLRELNEALSRHGQWVALDPPHADRSTIGGLLATNDSGPHRHHFGTPRDLVIGITVATADGQVAKAGGQVVKNVAGYDLSKLVSGSFGALAGIVGATFKLSPVPAASSTVVVSVPDSSALAEMLSAMAASQLEPVAFDLHASRPNARGGSITCLLRFASVPAAVDAQVEAARAMLQQAGASSIDVVREADEGALWEAHSSRVWLGHRSFSGGGDASGAVVRASWLPADAGSAVHRLDQLSTGGPIEMIGRAMVGSGLIRIDGDVARQVSAIRELRASNVFGNVAIVRGRAELRTSIDVWPPLSAPHLAASVKRALDPNGTLGAGRGPV